MEHHSTPGVYPTFPTGFRLFPEALPRVIPPPIKERSFRAPFGIDKDLYNFALRPEIPFTFAALYVALVLGFNIYNRKRNYKPWTISKQSWFKYFVITHNVLLAVYSIATFLAMLRAIVHTLPSWHADNYGPRVADALCKVHGPRGLGDAATYNTSINIWEVKNTAIHLGYNGNPDPTDVGRLWNEGLAFWGWMFYVSKFYEVIDTAIILAKGKRSATLQTYHHAGAMLCMWAGIRYMSPPIWMFVFINSAIHAMMYIYFAASALGHRAPQSFKRTLTSFQIAQFVFGASYAAAHLFVKYDIPIEIPYHLTNYIEHAVSSASSAATAATKSATSVASAVSSFAESPTVAPTMGAWIKKMLLRAAGEEGVAERVGMEQRIRDGMRDPLGFAAQDLQGVEQKAEKWFEKRYETHYRSEWTKTDCIDTTGEAFAIYLNLLYLLPLTFLFGRFFFRAYTQRGNRRSISGAARKASEASKDASNQTEYEIERKGRQAEDVLENRASEAQEKGSDKLSELKKDVEDMKQGNFRDRRVSDRVQSYEKKVKTAAETAADKAKEGAEKAKDMAGNAYEKAKGSMPSGTSSPRRTSPSKRSPADNESAVEDEPAAPASRGGNGSGNSGKPSTAESGKPQGNSTDNSQPAQKNGGSSAAGPEKSQPKKTENSQPGSAGSEKNGGSSAAGPDKPHAKSTENSQPTSSGPDKNAKPAKPEEKKSTDANNKDSQPKGASNNKEQGSQIPRAASGQKGDSSKPASNSSQNDNNKGSQAKSADNDKGQDQDEEIQEVNLGETQAVRPGTGVNGESLAKEGGEAQGVKVAKSQGDSTEGRKKTEEQTDVLVGDAVKDEENSDAMGQSGSIIDVTKEKAEDAAGDANGNGNST
ncbi:hypothetical protein LTR09_010848 [Extremus antarcticus]|uniref:Elongation of fatty acids protein n=1 Tax=Extremus antarcticus TaxID=702011 RepID=A0AAJ0DCZ0_9PEZI|nr:hypothetical protein LTR09_010848 [Extremus antarcticus]